ncbi:MMB_0454 family protein [Mycoplasma phocoenae]|uniref:Uncharacterized protein n=1 Tax=Mycoplasma phocoenae TaxID=754517 RepID=A0A858U751_9MOLU|nr:hypothetical protein [Mycoplasma phocoenae]QJG67095.1 hypothetical protein HGG69_02105 [Mycoplasma phocoenae]
MQDFIKANSNNKVNLHVHVGVLVQTIEKNFASNKNVKFNNGISVLINKSETNVSYEIDYSIAKDANPIFETNNIMFQIEQITYSVLNIKPINIRLNYIGEF